MQTATRIRSRLMRLMASEGFAKLLQRGGRLRRRLAGGEPTVHYFHELTDPFSHLAVQRLPALAERYGLRFVPHLASGAADEFRGDAARFDDWALRDARSVAVCFDVAPPPAGSPEVDSVAAYSGRLAPLVRAAAGGEAAALRAFADAAVAIGAEFWSGAIATGEAAHGAADLVAEGNALRTRLGHYQGGMFHFDGEWFWGLDRADLLERRLLAEGFSNSPEAPLVVPRPSPVVPAGLDASAIRLEVFPSLRSPYTAVGFPALQQLIAETGVSVDWRPVMPMMMRGVPAPRAKQLWVMTDSAREARALDVPFRRFVDPFGEPVRRALSLWAWVRDEGREEAFLESYLRAAWSEGIDITIDEGLAVVVARAGLDPAAMAAHLGDERATAIVDENLDVMLGAGLWGVPSFRVLGGDAEVFECWGQDRIWRVCAEIVRRAGGDPGIALPEPA